MGFSGFLCAGFFSHKNLSIVPIKVFVKVSSVFRENTLSTNRLSNDRLRNNNLGLIKRTYHPRLDNGKLWDGLILY